jgi:hypothetical protein
MKMRVTWAARFVFAFGLALATAPAARVSATDSRISVKKPPITCPAGQLAFQKPDGRWVCIAADSNPCPQGQALDTTTKAGLRSARACR